MSSRKPDRVNSISDTLTSDPKLLARADPAPPCTLVIFGAGGDLTKRLLMPSLYNMTVAGLFDDEFSVIGIDAVEGTDDVFRSRQTETMQGFVTNKGGEFHADGLNQKAWGWLRDRLHYQQGDFGQDATFTSLKERLDQLHAESRHSNCVFYLAVADRFFGPIVDHLAAAGLLQEGDGAFRRIVVEKPFGHDLQSARELNARILKVANENQVFRIDHFLGKETVQNIMALRFSNGLFEPLWNRDHIDHVQITASETVGVETRGKFYEITGALRDMVPNHMFQLLAMVAMEPPNSFDADAVRSEKAKVVSAIHRLTVDTALVDAVRGQYVSGKLDGLDVPAYRSEPNVDPNSRTETFVAMKFAIENWRWAGVPFYICTGKRMAVRDTQISIHFKQAPFAMFRDTPVARLAHNVMTIHVQPEEGVDLQFSAKVPGPVVHLGPVHMNFRYADYFGADNSTGYETLLYDVLIGDSTLFQRADNVEAGWAAVQPLLDAWAGHRGDVQDYAAGSMGPVSADELLARDGRLWMKLA